MSMGCSMVPMMFPGFQQYMPPMGIGMGMGMEMGLSRPMMPFPNILAGAPSATPAAAAHLVPRFPVPPFHVPPIPAPDPSRVQPTNQVDPMLGSPGQQNPNQPRVPSFVDPYQHYLGLYQMHLPGVPQVYIHLFFLSFSFYINLTRAFMCLYLCFLDKKLPSFQLFHVWSWVVFIASKMQINIHKEDLHPFMFWRDFIFWHIRFSIIVFWRVFLFFRPELVNSSTCLGWGYKLSKSFFFPQSIILFYVLS